MFKFIKPFSGATGGDPFPKQFKVGEQCPDDLIEAAVDQGVVEDSKGHKDEANSSADGAADKRGRRSKPST